MSKENSMKIKIEGRSFTLIAKNEAEQAVLELMHGERFDALNLDIRDKITKLRFIKDSSESSK